MNKKVLSILMAIVLIISAVAFPNVFAKEDTTEAQTHFEKTENGITLSVDLDKPEYASNVNSGNVTTKFTVKNDSKNSIYFHEPCIWYNAPFLTDIKHDANNYFDRSVYLQLHGYQFFPNAEVNIEVKPGETYSQNGYFGGKYYSNPGVWKAVETGEYSGVTRIEYYTVDPKINKDAQKKTLSVDFKVKYVDKPSTSGNAEPADVQLDVTEVGTVGDGIVTGDDTKLYAVIRNNGTEKGTAKVTVNFSVAGSRVETKTYEVNVDPGKSTVVTSTKDWTADFGSWSVRADIRQEGANADARAIRQSYIKSRVAVAD